MRRDYSVEEYLERLRKLREARPGIAVTTDIIVGFPGETEEDFEGTLKLTEQVRYENQFSFVYSPRPKTSAALRENDWGPIPHEVKIARLERLQKIQKRITTETFAARVGQVEEVLVEGPSWSDPEKRFGRTAHNRSVTFTGDAPTGALVSVLIERSSAAALFGTQRQLVSLPTVSIAEPLRQVESCVA
jgi:tRNA-2-methylthio-N6-dimethylallyladenosine synthase